MAEMRKLRAAFAKVMKVRKGPKAYQTSPNSLNLHHLAILQRHPAVHQAGEVVVVGGDDG